MTIDWKAITFDILNRLDIASEAEAIGVVFAPGKPSPKGWRSCHAIDREDRTPSAGVNVSSGNGTLGQYKDQGGNGLKCGFFELAAKLQPGRFPSFRDARKYYAEKAGVKLPTRRQNTDGLAMDQCRISVDDPSHQLTRSLALMWSKEKPPIDPSQVLRARPFVCRWVKRFTCLAFRGYRPNDWSNPTAILLYRYDGKPFPEVKSKKGKTVLSKRKAHNLRGSKDSLVIVGTVDELQRASTVWDCEGLGDALSLAAVLPDDHIAVTNTSGAGSFDESLTEAFRDKRVITVMDADRAGMAGRKTRCARLLGVADEVYSVELPYPVEENHGKDVRDLASEGRLSELLALAESSKPITKEQVDDWKQELRDQRENPEVVVSTSEYRTNDDAIGALSANPDVYQRAGMLVHVIVDRFDGDGVQRDEQPRIAFINEAVLRDYLTRCCQFVRLQVDGDDEERIPAHPPAWTVKAIHQRGFWPGLRRLHGLVCSPIVRPDGSVLCTPGYDDRTGLYCQPGVQLPDFPDHPKKLDAQAAAERLLDVVCDFPFQTEAHKAAWLALLLTPLARYAFSGPAPMFLVDANVAGAGKTKLIELVSRIAWGRDIARTANPRDDDEMRKRIMSLAVAGDPMILVDNVAGMLRGAALEAALTSTFWKERVLGRMETVELPLSTIWTASGNNVVLGDDMPRRVVHIRLDSPVECPEERTDFKHSRLVDHVQTIRGQLVADALTILSAFIQNGKPQSNLCPWGSFEGWSDLIRAAVVWCGLKDPGATRQGLRSVASGDVAALRAVIEAWPWADPSNNGLTTAQIIELVGTEREEQGYWDFKDAILDFAPPNKGNVPTARQLGNRLGKVRRRIIGDKAIDFSEIGGRKRVWKVVKNVDGKLGNFDCSTESDSSDTSDLVSPQEKNGSQEVEKREKVVGAENESLESFESHPTNSEHIHEWQERITGDGWIRTGCSICGQRHPNKPDRRATDEDRQQRLEIDR